MSEATRGESERRIALEGSLERRGIGKVAPESKRAASGNGNGASEFEKVAKVEGARQRAVRKGF